MWLANSAEELYERSKEANVSEERADQLEKFWRQEITDHCETELACRKIALKALTHSEVYGDGYQVPLEEVFRMVVERLTKEAP